MGRIISSYVGFCNSAVIFGFEPSNCNPTALSAAKYVLNLLNYLTP